MAASHEAQIHELARQVNELRDIEEIRTLIARYHSASDGTLETGTHQNPDEIAELFAPDGVWNVQGGSFTGRAEIVAKARQLQSIPAIVHVPVVHAVAIDGAVARSEFKCIVSSRRSVTSPPSWSVGIYRAVTVRTPQGWRFQELTWEHLVRPDAGIAGPDEVTRPEVR